MFKLFTYKHDIVNFSDNLLKPFLAFKLCKGQLPINQIRNKNIPDGKSNKMTERLEP